MAAERNQAVDMVRAIALFGIAVVNLPFLALPADATLYLPADGIDRIAVVLVELLFQAKFFLLFSFIFGWGIEIQFRAANQKGASFARRFSRRLACLAVLGMLHATLVFTGDILLLYALLGLVAWAARPLPTRSLLMLAAGLVPVAAGCLILLGLMLQGSVVPPDTPNLGGSFIEAVQARWRDWPDSFGFLVLFQGHLALAAFLAGITAARTGFFETGNLTAARLKRAVPLLLAAGLVLNSGYVLGLHSDVLPPALTLAGLSGLALGGPVLALAWLGMILMAADRIRLPGFLILAGRNSLTCYVLQGILAGLVFGGYGLGLFGTLGQMALLPLSLGLTVLSMVLTSVFARVFGHGPLELLLRRVTYG